MYLFHLFCHECYEPNECENENDNSNDKKLQIGVFVHEWIGVPLMFGKSQVCFFTDKMNKVNSCVQHKTITTTTFTGNCLSKPSIHARNRNTIENYGTLLLKSKFDDKNQFDVSVLNVSKMVYQVVKIMKRANVHRVKRMENEALPMCQCICHTHDENITLWNDVYRCHLLITHLFMKTVFVLHTEQRKNYVRPIFNAHSFFRVWNLDSERQKEVTEDDISCRNYHRHNMLSLHTKIHTQIPLNVERSLSWNTSSM